MIKKEKAIEHLREIIKLIEEDVDDYEAGYAAGWNDGYASGLDDGKNNPITKDNIDWEMGE